ncbi:MAG: MG2 domain-containing protein [Candidatus Brocadiia bacterium]
MEKADELFEQKHYKEAAAAYAAVVEAEGEQWHRAAERVVMCRLRLRLFDEAIEAALDYVKRTAGAPQEARAERLTGHLYMLLPHWGTRSGGEFHRAEHRQGIRLHSWQYDKRHAVRHMERARELYARHDGPGAPEGWHTERIECIFDLVNLISRFTIYDDQPQFWFRWWQERDEFLAETAGETDFEEALPYWEMHRKRPIGLRVGPDGEPVFPGKPDDYAADLTADEKMLYLLEEVRGLDETAKRKHTALSYYRQAMLARKRFGMDRLNQYAGMYYGPQGERPLQEEMKSFNPWELKDDQALTLVAGRIRVVTLPEQYDVFGLLRTVSGDYGGSETAPQARYAAGVYYQSRQQYNDALDEYEALRELFPRSNWASQAAGQMARIKAAEVSLSGSTVQLPERPLNMEFTYRNLDRVWFRARRFDLKKLLADVHAMEIEEDNNPWRRMQLLQGWHHTLSQGHVNHEDTRFVARYLGAECAQWTESVEDEGTHRSATAATEAPLKEPGAYLVHAYTARPPRGDARKDGLQAVSLGASRAVVVITDVSFVEKKTDRGMLYYVADAASGAPIPGAELRLLEEWRTHDRDRKKNVWHTKRSRLETDEQGMVLFEEPAYRHARRHLIIESPRNTLGFSGIHGFDHYYPSGMRQGEMAYVITDRPVYRPEQTVRYKVWTRRLREGIMENMPSRPVTVNIYDARGDKVHTASHRTDEFGGLDGQFTLEEEPPLGQYRIEVVDFRMTGGQSFRVEEYKKPEFEVTVEPSRSHAKLGEKLTALIKAQYYFGAPVTDATVSYKVFREEYSHTYHFPGEWDWLYGRGYGRSWYGYDWFPWWSEMRCCWSPPTWWGYSPRSPARELVKQGESRIGSDGTVELEIDTAPALENHPDRDHRYIVEADVRDASRRVISGQGDVKVTRQAFYAMVQSDRGYYRPGEEMEVTVRCVTPDNRPVRTEGVLTVSRVVFGGPNNARIEQEKLERWTAETDGRGTLSFRMRHEKSDQLVITFTAPDEWGGTVTGRGVVWVVGRDFSGRLYRFNDLELITDRRTYQPGDTAHLMINTRRPDSYVLFADEVDNGALLDWRLLHLRDGHTVVDIPIREGDKPNFFVEATTIADARVHQEAKRICVPPEDKVVKLDVRTDKTEYRPGEEATVSVDALTPTGEPADVQLCLSAFDKSVLYIQDEYTPPIAKFFHGRLRGHHPSMTTNLLERFAAMGRVQEPFRTLHPLPPGWQGTWDIGVKDWAAITQEEFDELTGGAYAYGRRQALGRGVLMEEQAEAPMAMAANAVAADGVAKAAPAEAEGRGGAEPDFAQAEVRTEFADTALWLADLRTGPDGKATATLTMPENLTTWKLNTWAMSRESRVGETSNEAVTTKNLLVRLQAPRFFMERDEVVLSANVHNYLGEAKTARVSLDVPQEHLSLMEGHPRTVDVRVPADGEKRVDWRVKVLKEGTADVTVSALTDEESDAMRMSFPVLVHGMTKQDSYCGSMRPDERDAVQTVEFTVPEERRPELTRLEVQFAPSLVGAMMDALPYCLDYPYGCTEQTVSRFLPAVLTLKTLRNMGISLEDVRDIRGRMDEVRRIEKGEHRRIYADSPVFDSNELHGIIRKGLKRIREMQHGDGGWGWWRDGDSSPYLTAYVLFALNAARDADVQVEADIIDRGMEFLRAWETAELKEDHWSPHSRHAFAAYVLSVREVQAEDCVDRLYEGRDELNLYGKALLTLTLDNLGQDERARTVLRNIMQYLQENPETGIAWFRTPQQGWWYWWNNDIETNAWCLRAIVRLEPNSEVAPRLVKWLLENRRNGYYWRSTRDTTLCVAAMSDFVVASGEGRPDYTLTLSLDDGAVEKTVRISKENFFTYDNRLVVEGVALEGGRHTLTLKKDGPGALYWSAWVRYFTREENIGASGLQLKLRRRYFRLEQIPYEVEVEGSEGQKLTEERLRYERVPLEDGDRLESGDLVQIELEVEADNDYTYLLFEDMKPAGCEPLRVRSGGKGQEGFYSYMELRDEKVAFFADSIGRGKHLLRYRMRAEVPGIFHALPAVVQGMYAPELRANSNEKIIPIREQQP